MSQQKQLSDVIDRVKLLAELGGEGLDSVSKYCDVLLDEAGASVETLTANQRHVCATLRIDPRTYAVSQAKRSGSAVALSGLTESQATVARFLGLKPAEMRDAPVARVATLTHPLRG